MTRAPCRRRNWRSSASCSKVRWLDNGWSQLPVHCREQDLATQWIYLIRVKRNLHMRWREVYQTSWSRRTDQKLYAQTTRWNLGEHVKVCHGITALPHLVDPRHMAALRAVRRVKDGTSAVLQSGSDERWWSDCTDCDSYLRHVQDLLADGKTQCEKRFGEPFKGPKIPFGAMIEHHPISARDQSRIHQFGKKVLPGIFLGYEPVAGENLERTYSDSGHGRFGKTWMDQKFICEESIRKDYR